MPLFALLLLTLPPELTFQTLLALLKLAERKKRFCAVINLHPNFAIWLCSF